MSSLSDEQEAKLLTARSTEEVAELLKADGQEVTAEAAERFFRKVQAQRADMPLSLDELDAVSGGKRNWIQDGCAATVEDGSDCWGTDACDHVNVCYQNFNAASKCPNHNGPHSDEVVECVSGSAFGVPVYTTTYRCKYCGRTHQESGATPPYMPMGGPGLIIMD